MLRIENTGLQELQDAATEEEAAEVPVEDQKYQARDSKE